MKREMGRAAQLTVPLLKQSACQDRSLAKSDGKWPLFLRFFCLSRADAVRSGAEAIVRCAFMSPERSNRHSQSGRFLVSYLSRSHHVSSPALSSGLVARTSPWSPAMVQRSVPRVDSRSTLHLGSRRPLLSCPYASLSVAKATVPAQTKKRFSRFCFHTACRGRTWPDVISSLSCSWETGPNLSPFCL